MVDRTYCFYCRRKFQTDNHLLHKTIDHFIPVSRGGLNNDENKVHSCYECNQWKGSLLPEDWLKKVQKFIKRKVNRGTYNKHNYGEIIGAIKHKLSKINMKKASTYNY